MKNRNPSYKDFLSAKLNSSNNHTGHYRRSLFSIVVLGVYLSGCSGLHGSEVNSMPSAHTEFTFEQYEVVTGSAKHQTVLTGFLLGGTIAELVVVNIDAEDNRRLRIYAFDGESWTLRLDAALRPEVLFVDVANINGRDRLITYESGRLNWFDPESATEHPLVEVTSNTLPPEGEIPSLVAPAGVRRRRFDHEAPGVMTGRVLHALTDMNHDGVADLAIFSLQAGRAASWGRHPSCWACALPMRCTSGHRRTTALRLQRRSAP